MKSKLELDIIFYINPKDIIRGKKIISNEPILELYLSMLILH